MDKLTTSMLTIVSTLRLAAPNPSSWQHAGAMVFTGIVEARWDCGPSVDTAEKRGFTNPYTHIFVYIYTYICISRNMYMTRYTCKCVCRLCRAIRHIEQLGVNMEFETTVQEFDSRTHDAVHEQF